MPRSNIVLSRDHLALHRSRPPAPTLVSHNLLSDVAAEETFDHPYLIAPGTERLQPYVKVDDVKDIPNSVKGAPAHLRQAIRKRQNSESAKRSRQRRKQAAKVFYEKFDEQCRRISSLEQKVANLTNMIRKEMQGDTRKSESRKPSTSPKVENMLPSPESVVEYGTPAPSLSDPTEEGDSPSSTFRTPQSQPSILQSMASVSADAYGEDEVPFEDDIDALLDTCIHHNLFTS